MTQTSPPEDAPAIEAEIVEVVAVDEDEPPPSASEDVEVLFDEDVAPVPPSSSAETDQERVDRERHLRLLADLENLQKRFERERQDLVRSASFELIRRLLPILDGFERALAAPGGSEDAFRGGMALIHRQLADELKAEGLRPVEAVGAEFDPSVHEAVATDETADAPVGTVLAELQRGYFFGDRLLRPALVVVAKVKSAPAEPAAE